MSFYSETKRTTRPKKRALAPFELKDAWRVFHDTLPYSRITVSLTRPEDFGVDANAMMWCGSGGTGRDSYTIRMGNIYERNGRPGLPYYQNPSRWGVLIHELVHVWQAHHGGGCAQFNMHYVGQAILARGRPTYRYTLGKRWREYNVEQQAEIVEHWYLEGGVMDDQDPRFSFIRDHIWKGRA